ncbi:M81 family metallopeptidase [Bordetella holmesii]|nr:M81 family metallopeptidase [Bordetella holmesii]QGB15793.1 M81 family metallopeptidase [Bordetella holmesii]QGB65039.1 M81 family metallopeptidase [Bordetella holmesii]QGC43589.1 M81 family metallopeptidase [Bordetella holmesii]QGC63499.1 M81 family metallopeptidase [Bordetella holmesii]
MAGPQAGPHLKEQYMRWLLAMIKHETNTFSPVPTPLARFFRGNPEILWGERAIRAYENTDSGLGGISKWRGEKAHRSWCRLPPSPGRARPRMPPPTRPCATSSWTRYAKGAMTRSCWICTAPWSPRAWKTPREPCCTGCVKSIPPRRSA